MESTPSETSSSSARRKAPAGSPLLLWITVCVVILVVDRTCSLPRRMLAALAGRHDVVVVRVGDPLLDGGIKEGVVPVADVEKGRRWIAGRIRGGRRNGSVPGVDFVDLSTNQDYLPAVQALFDRRERRRAG